MVAQKIIDEDLTYIVNSLRREFSAMRNKNVLLTGGAGFLGYYLVQAIDYWNKHNPSSLINLFVYDSFQRGRPAWLNRLAGNEGVYLKEHNIINPLPVDAPDFSYIIHAASIASPIYYRLHPIETMDANVQGLRNLLDYSLKQQEKGSPIISFLNFSTSEIYGDPLPENIPTHEDYKGNVSCTGPRACYDESKRYGETLCVNYQKQYGVPVKTARPFNNYGPGLKISDRRALPDFARDIFEGRDITLLSNGGPTRTFCYVADAVIGYYKILVNGRDGEAYNIGTEAPEISIKFLADLVVNTSEKLFGYKGKVVFKQSTDKEYLTDNPNRRCPVITKARTEVGYNPMINIEEGIKRSLLWYSINNVGEDL